MVFASSAFAIALALGMGSAAGAASVHGMPTGYSLGNNGNTLVTFGDLADPTNMQGRQIVDGSGTPTPLSALAYRPQTRQLYGFSNQTNTVYEVNPQSGRVSSVASTSDGTTVDEIGFNFNNQVDAARIVSTAEDNLVFFPNNTPPSISRFTSLFYAAGDVNEGRNPGVFANAYTNAVPDATTTQQFVLDGEWDILATLANNAGELSTVGEVWVDGSRLDFSATGGFDILSMVEGDNTAFAVLTTALGTGVYHLPLSADADGRIQATRLGMPGDRFGTLEGLAVAPAPVPLPAGIWLLLSGLGALAGTRRWRKTG